MAFFGQCNRSSGSSHAGWVIAVRPLTLNPELTGSSGISVRNENPTDVKARLFNLKFPPLWRPNIRQPTKLRVGYTGLTHPVEYDAARCAGRDAKHLLT